MNTCEIAGSSCATAARMRSIVTLNIPIESSETSATRFSPEAKTIACAPGPLPASTEVGQWFWPLPPAM